MVQFIVVSEGYFMIALALHWNAFRFNSGKFPTTGFNQKQIPPFARFLLLFSGTFWLDHLIMWLAEMPTILLRTDKTTLLIIKNSRAVYTRKNKTRLT